MGKIRKRKTGHKSVGFGCKRSENKYSDFSFFGCKRFRKGFFNFGFFGSIIPLIAPNRNSAFKEKSFWFRKMLMINVFGDKSC